MKIYIASDHRGFETKNKLIDWLKAHEYKVEDCGNTVYDGQDDYVDFANNLTKKMNPKKDKGILICGSGIGVSMATNRSLGFRCALAFNEDQIKHGVENDHINALALASDYFDLGTLQRFIQIFLSSKPMMLEKYMRRSKKLDLIK